MAKKKPRPLPEIEKEYANLCQQIGEREYRRRVLEMEISGLSKRALDVNQEAARAKEGHGD